jgi:hypothetical protein
VFKIAAAPQSRHISAVKLQGFVKLWARGSFSSARRQYLLDANVLFISFSPSRFIVDRGQARQRPR